jgi:hypothetical protein
MRKASLALISAVLLGFSGGAALAFSETPAPAGPAGESAASDPDAVLDHLADGAAGGSGTELTTGGQYPAGPRPAAPVPPAAGNAEPVNPAWPAWMVWHQQ